MQPASTDYIFKEILIDYRSKTIIPSYKVKFIILFVRLQLFFLLIFCQNVPLIVCSPHLILFVVYTKLNILTHLLNMRVKFFAYFNMSKKLFCIEKLQNAYF